MTQGIDDEGDIAAFITRKKRDEWARIRADHSSPRSSCPVIRNYTLPRIFRSCSHTSCGARSSKPFRTVGVASTLVPRGAAKLYRKVRTSL